jgi:pre-mRNA-splicing factor ATP-dependent RNA helicase DHX38/PRP16
LVAGAGEGEEAEAFGGASAAYVARREEQVVRRASRKLSAQRQQIDRDNDLWERNRMLTSGVVHAISVNTDLDEVLTSKDRNRLPQNWVSGSPNRLP